MVSKIWMCLMILLLATAGVGMAARPSGDQIEIDGLVLDQTKTKAGHDFFGDFSTLWEAPAGAEAHNIVVMETASPQWGSVVWIKVNDVLVFRNLLKPRAPDIRDLAGKAVEKIREYVMVYLKEAGQAKDDDIAASGW